MKAPVDWLREHADLPDDLTPRQLADALLRIGIEVERVEDGAEQLSGPIVVGRVLAFGDEPQKNGKTIRWCQVDVGTHNGDAGSRGIVCGAHNFAVDDLVVVCLPGAVLPGNFAITARKTYGHTSGGMICSVRELGIGIDHDGILVLPAGSATPGDDALDVLGLRDAVLDVAVTTDRGYTLSIRGLAREAAAALDVPFHDVQAEIPPADGRAYDIRIEDPSACTQFSARAVTGLDPQAPSPDWMVRRLRQCNVRAISLAVDVTNYVMLETGQPLHAYDLAKLSGPIVSRRARPGEQITTLDGVVHTLDPTDVVVTDDSGPVSLAGLMGGGSTEIGASTSDVLLEAAAWIPQIVARTSRRQKLPSEAARRFERGVDPKIAAVALARCVELLVTYGGARPVDGFTVIGEPAVAKAIELPATMPETVAGMPIDRTSVLAHLDTVGCTVDDSGASLRVTPPSWRPDLLLAADLVEEIVRLAGYDRLPSVLPHAPAGGGLTGRQQLNRNISRAVASAGLSEIVSFPFVSPALREMLGGRSAVRLVNPISADEPELRTSLLPGLLTTAVRNIGRGLRDLALYETGLVFLPRTGSTAAPVPGVDSRPSADDIAALDAALPEQPRRLGAVLCGNVEPAGWWGSGRLATWADAVEVAQLIARTARVELSTRSADTAGEATPWHPGRCAVLLFDGGVIGHAGELHPRVIAGLGLPERTCAVELDLDALPVARPASAPVISGYPPVLLDVALVVDNDVAAASLERTLRTAAGPLLEELRLFDVYTDAERLGGGVRSLAFALRFRASDRTLKLDEATAARDAAIQAAADEHGARLRG